MNNKKEKVLFVVQIVFSAFCFLAAIGGGFHFSSILFIIAGVLLAPIKKLRYLLSEKLNIKPWIAVTGAVVIMLAGMFTMPADPAKTEEDTSTESSIERAMPTQDYSDDSSTDEQLSSLNTETTMSKATEKQTEAEIAKTTEAKKEKTTADIKNTKPTEKPSTTKASTTKSVTNASTIKSETKATTKATTKSPVTQKVTTSPQRNSAERDYILNTSTSKFHYPSCGSVKKMSNSNKKEFHGTREEAIAKGYEPCGNCHP